MTVGTYRFGNQIPGTGNVGCGLPGGGLFQSGANSGIAISITARVSVVSGTHNFQCALYLYGVTSTLLGTTEIKSLSNTSRQWVQFDFVAPAPSINASTQYGLMIWADSTSTDIGLEIVAFTRLSQVGVTYNNWADWAFIEIANRRVDIYCDYDPLAAPPAWIMKPGHLTWG